MPRGRLTSPARPGVAGRVRRGDAVVVPRVGGEPCQGHGVAGPRRTRRAQAECGCRDPVVDAGRRRLVGRPGDRGAAAASGGPQSAHHWRRGVGWDRHLEGAWYRARDRVDRGVACGIGGGDAVVVRRAGGQASQTHRVGGSGCPSGVLRQGSRGGPVVDACRRGLVRRPRDRCRRARARCSHRCHHRGAVASTAAGTWKVRGAEPVTGSVVELPAASADVTR